MPKTPAYVMNPNDHAFTPRFEYGDQAQSLEVIGTPNSELGAGYVRMTGADIPWTTKYDEVVVVLEGEIEIETPNGTLRAKQHETIWLPAQTNLTYRSDSALIFYAIHPSNWAT